MPPPDAVERIAPVVTDVSVAAASFQVDLAADQVTDLGSFQALMLFDPAVVQFSSAANGGLLGSTGRTVVCAPPESIPNYAGSGTTRLAFSCDSSGPLPGANGSGVLAQVQFAPLAPGFTILELQPSLRTTSDVQIDAVTLAGIVNVEGVEPTDTPTAAPTDTPAPSDTPTGTPTPVVTPVPAVERIAPIAHDVTLADPPAQVSVLVEGVTDLGAYEAKVLFDPARAAAVAHGRGLPRKQGPHRVLRALHPDAELHGHRPDPRVAAVQQQRPGARCRRQRRARERRLHSAHAGRSGDRPRAVAHNTSGGAINAVALAGAIIIGAAPTPTPTETETATATDTSTPAPDTATPTDTPERRRPTRPSHRPTHAVAATDTPVPGPTDTPRRRRPTRPCRRPT